MYTSMEMVKTFLADINILSTASDPLGVGEHLLRTPLIYTVVGYVTALALK